MDEAFGRAGLNRMKLLVLSVFPFLFLDRGFVASILAVVRPNASERRHDERSPRGQRFSRPYPHTGRNANNERHENLDIEDGRLRSETRLRVRIAVFEFDVLEVFDLFVLEPVGIGVGMPLLSGEIFVEVTANDDRRRNGVENGKDADSNHELFEFVAARRIALDHFANSKERRESGDDKRRADNEKERERRNNKTGHRVDVLRADEANARQFVAVDFLKNERDDSHDERQDPSDEMIIERHVLYGLVAPLHPGGKKPSKSENDPPNGRGHHGEIEYHEGGRAAGMIGVAFD